jgi:hypothetical protein
MTIVHTIIEALADAKGKDPDELEFILEDHIDTDAL